MKKEVLRESTGLGDVLNIPRKFTSYEVTKTIGIGGYSVVVEVKDASTGVEFAAKVLRRPESNSDEMKVLERELRLGETVSCPYLVTFVEVVYLEHIIIVIMERSSGNELMTLIVRSPGIVIMNWKKIFTHICLGVQYLHNKGLSHRDLKAENILVDDEFNCKLCDYGFMCESRKGSVSTTMCGTMVYMSPEMLQQVSYDAKTADVWALGVLLYVILIGSAPWNGENEMSMLAEIACGIPGMELLLDTAQSIILKCCDVNMETRASIDQIVWMLTGSIGQPPGGNNQMEAVGIPLKSSKGVSGSNHCVHSPMFQRMIRVPSGNLVKPPGPALAQRSHFPPVMKRISKPGRLQRVIYPNC